MTLRGITRSILGMAVALALLAAPAHAQTGRIGGTVTTSDGAPIYGAQATLVGTRFSAISGPDGAFLIAGVPAGSYQLRISALGFTEQVETVSVSAGGTARADARLSGRAIELSGVVVSASRRAERITDAPASVVRLDAAAIESSLGTGFLAALKNVQGLDFVQIGMTSAAVNARGFNSSFNNRMLMMEDGRIAVLPENGLPVGQFTALPKIDLAGVEVLVGPGAALYGADASSGVITLQSKDPRQFPGTTVELTGGNRSYRNVQARHASVFGDWGVKVAGEYQGADDWDNVLTYNITGVAGAPNGLVAVRENQIPDTIDWNAQVIRGTAAVVRYMGASRVELSGGASQSDGVGQTNVGRNQLRDWRYNFVQARLTTPRLYFNLYRTQSQSGESFAINRYADAWARNPQLSSDSLRRLSDWPSDGRMLAADAQHNFTLPMALNTRVIWGAGFRRDVVSSDRQWLTDRLTGQDIEIDQKGIFAQTETPLLPQLNLVLAARYDQHENYDAQFSPKAGLVFKPAPDQAIRLTYNRAFKSPTTLQTNFHIPDWTAFIAIYGNTQGFTARDAGGAVVATYNALRPEENETIEIGYKGVLAQRLFVDGVYYRSNYEHFLSPLVIIANPFASPARFAYDGAGDRILNPAGISPVTLTYLNLGKAELHGADLGVNFFATQRLRLNGTFSWLDLRSVEVPAGSEEATALNSPGTKWTVGGTMTELPLGGGSAHFGASTRYVNGYYFRSGINMGRIPTFAALDLNAGYRLPGRDVSINLGVQNLFACSQAEAFEYAATDALRRNPINRERACDFGQRHIEMINMPAIGTMVFLGLRVHR